MAAHRNRTSIAANHKAGLNDIGFPNDADDLRADDLDVDRLLDRLLEDPDWRPTSADELYSIEDIEPWSSERVRTREISPSELDRLTNEVAAETAANRGHFVHRPPIAWYVGHPGYQLPSYQPQSRWGIFWNEPRFERFVINLCLNAGLIAPGNAHAVQMRAFKEVALLARRNIRRHERTHHAVEMACQTAHALKGSGPYVAPPFVNPRAYLEEILASREEMLTNREPLSEIRDTGIARLIKDTYEAAPRSGPYAQWNRAASPRARAVLARRLATALGWPAAAAGLILREVDQNSDEVPEYWVNTHRALLNLP